MRRWLYSVLSLVGLATLVPGALSNAGSPAEAPAAVDQDDATLVQLHATIVEPEAVRYGLRVVELPPAPKFAAAPVAAAPVSAPEAVSLNEKPSGARPASVEQTVRPVPSASQCPVELRAIIAGGEKDGFAMVSVEGESSMLRRGDRVRTALGTAKVSSLSNTHMTLTGGFGRRQCALDSER